MAALQTVELKIRGMDCAECTQHVKHALQSVAGVEKADVLLAAEKAIVRLDPSKARSDLLMKAVEKAGYSIVDPRADGIRTAKIPENEPSLSWHWLAGLCCLLLFWVNGWV